jgi:hypothetical protein
VSGSASTRGRTGRPTCTGWRHFCRVPIELSTELRLLRFRGSDLAFEKGAVPAWNLSNLGIESGRLEPAVILAHSSAPDRRAVACRYRRTRIACLPRKQLLTDRAPGTPGASGSGRPSAGFTLRPPPSRTGRPASRQGRPSDSCRGR